MKVTAEAACRFLAARHFLAPARSLAGPDGVLEVFRRFGSIQYDPIAAAGRNHDLVLHPRVAGYEPAWCDVLYERREIFETTNKAGRIEPRIDRERSVVEVLGLWWEDGFAPDRADGFADAMREALRAYLGFAGADRLEWAPHLGRSGEMFL